MTDAESDLIATVMLALEDRCRGIGKVDLDKVWDAAKRLANESANPEDVSALRAAYEHAWAAELELDKAKTRYPALMPAVTGRDGLSTRWRRDWFERQKADDREAMAREGTVPPAWTRS